MSQVILFAVLFLIAAMFHLLGSTVACLLVGIKIPLVSFGFGPLLKSIPTRITKLEFRSIPLGGYVQTDIEDLNSRSRLTRIIVNLGGPLVCFASAAMLLTVQGASQHFVSTFGNLSDLVVRPKVEGAGLLANFFEFQTSHFAKAYGIIAAKCAAINLLPLPSLSGGKILFELLGLRSDGKFAERCNSVIAIALLYPVFRIVQAFYFYFRS